jgi:AcrR family transcriptional regulator
MYTAYGRALTSKGLATRARIVQAAADLVHRHGVAKTALLDVQKVSGSSGSQVYHYFESKDALVRAVAEWRVAEAVDYQDSFGPLDSIDALRRWADAQVALGQQLCSGGCPLGSLVSQLAESDEEARTTIGAGLAAWADRIETGLRAMAERGELAPEADPHDLATALLAALQGGLVLSQSQRRTDGLASALKVVVSYIETLITTSK